MENVLYEGEIEPSLWNVETHLLRLCLKMSAWSTTDKSKFNLCFSSWQDCIK